MRKRIWILCICLAALLLSACGGPSYETLGPDETFPPNTYAPTETEASAQTEASGETTQGAGEPQTPVKPRPTEPKTDPNADLTGLWLVDDVSLSWRKEVSDKARNEALTVLTKNYPDAEGTDALFREYQAAYLARLKGDGVESGYSYRFESNGTGAFISGKTSVDLTWKREGKFIKIRESGEDGDAYIMRLYNSTLSCTISDAAISYTVIFKKTQQ